MAYTLSEYESKELLREAGIPIPRERLIDTPDEAAEAAREVGLPVALKLCGRSIAHKTERDLVRLGLSSPDAVREAARDLLGRKGPGDFGARLLVGPMVRGRRELIAGLVRDAQFGPCVMLGIGGIFAEALSDVAFAAAPLAKHDAEELIGSLRFGSILKAFRGEPALERAGLVRILEGLAAIGVARPDVRSIDVNPLILCEGRPVVVDALVEIEERAA
jgi:acetate---CoA ligase (ADP-forming) subunit beta